MSHSLFPLALLALLANPFASPVSQDWEEQVAAQIEAIHREIAADYDYASDMLIGELEHDESVGFELQLEGDADYVIVGVCDADCDDLDLVVYDPEQDQVAADVEGDDYPVIRVQGEGTFWLEVGMAECAADTCLYGVQVLVRR